MGYLPEVVMMSEVCCHSESFSPSIQWPGLAEEAVLSAGSRKRWADLVDSDAEDEGQEEAAETSDGEGAVESAADSVTGHDAGHDARLAGAKDESEGQGEAAETPDGEGAVESEADSVTGHDAGHDARLAGAKDESEGQGEAAETSDGEGAVESEADSVTGHDAGHDARSAGAKDESTAGAEDKSSRVCWADLVDSGDEQPNDASLVDCGCGADAVKHALAENGHRQNKNIGKKTRGEPGQNMRTGQFQGKAKQHDRDYSKGAGKGIAKRVGKGSGKGSDKGVSKGTGKGVSKGAGKGSNAKPQGQFTVGIEEDPKFRIVRRILGVRGANMKSIAEKTGAKLRLRGRGSGFLEGDEQLESTDDLMLCISTQDQVGFENARNLAHELLQDIYCDYDKFRSKSTGLPEPRGIQFHKGYREGSR